MRGGVRLGAGGTGVGVRAYLPRRLSADPLAVGGTLGLMWLTGGPWALCVLLAAALHELGHLLAALCCRRSVERMHFGWMGASITWAGHTGGYGQDVFLALAGALANSVACLLLVPVIRTTASLWLLFFFFCNLGLGAFNLLPIRGLDGGVILYSLACAGFGLRAGRLALGIGTAVGLGLLLAAAGGLLGFWHNNPSIFVLLLLLFFRLLPGKTKRTA